MAATVEEATATEKYHVSAEVEEEEEEEETSVPEHPSRNIFFESPKRSLGCVEGRPWLWGDPLVGWWWCAQSLYLRRKNTPVVVVVVVVGVVVLERYVLL